MKKFILSISTISIGLVTTLLPVSGLADLWAFPQSISKITSPSLKWGPCGDPSTQTPTHFCTETHEGNVCVDGFNQQMIDGCKKHLPKNSCRKDLIKASIRRMGAASECNLYKPTGVDTDACIQDLNYYVSHC